VVSGIPAAADLQAAVRTLVLDKNFRSAKVAVSVVDVETGRVLAAVNDHVPVNPASNAKVYTAAAALALLRAEHRFATTLSGDGRDGAVRGALTLRGFGDPSLQTSDLADMVQELKRYGIRRVEGDILVDQRFFDDKFVPPAFEQQPNEWAAFRAPVSAVAVNQNTVTLAVRSTQVGQPAVVSFEPPGFVDAEGTVTTSEGGADNVILALNPKDRRLAARVAGTVAETSKLVRFSRRVDDPSLLGGYVLKHCLEQAGVKVSGEVKHGSGKDGRTLVRHTSEPLSKLLFALGKQSDNFYAEMVWKSIGGETKARPAQSDAAAGAVTEWLGKIGAADGGMVLRNGSGLFDSNRVTAWSLTSLLRWAIREPAVGPEFVAQLATGGVDGTLQKRFRNAPMKRNVRAKTGTLKDVISLAGYVMPPPGRSPVAFAIVFNDVEGKAAGARAAADKLVELVARRLWAKAP
jgi:D-alanyl-D-alanine carboxypeptidase/D-alanyl-D-alanine-endopeptidase (penicillin-binding protein 4)